MFIEPNDIEKLTKEQMEAYDQNPDACWECYSCVKIMPHSCVEVRGYDDFVPMGKQINPIRSSDSIMWEVKFKNGTTKKFKFPIK